MKKYAFASIFFLLISVTPVFARSGCCSHHGGVCGCGCCDGTSLSATCAPYYPSCNGGSTYIAPVVTKNPTPTPTRVYTPTPTRIITPTPSALGTSTTPTPTPVSTQASKSNGGGGLLALVTIGGGIWYWRKRKNRDIEEKPPTG